jgi:phosphoribosylanthranilate isomerase
MDLIVKICGLSSEETVDSALDAGADMVGLVCFPPSPRFVAPSRAATLAGRAHGRAEIAVLTVDMDEAGLAEIVEAVKPDWLQFHGEEAPEAVSSAAKRFGIRVMKAIGVRSASDLAGAHLYAAAADRLLIDAKPPKGAVLPGGNGEPFDWNILTGFKPGLSFMLSGGLHAGNVDEALRIARAAGVDVSSGVETAPGRKDPDLIRGFIAAARRAAAALPSGRTVERVVS